MQNHHRRYWVCRQIQMHRYRGRLPGNRFFIKFQIHPLGKTLQSNNLPHKSYQIQSYSIQKSKLIIQFVLSAQKPKQACIPENIANNIPKDFNFTQVLSNLKSGWKIKNFEIKHSNLIDPQNFKFSVCESYSNVRFRWIFIFNSNSFARR